MKMPIIEILDGSPMTPRTVYGIGRNYADHARELANEIPVEPIVFLKSISSLRPLHEGGLGHSDEVFHHEAEVVLLIGKPLMMCSKATWDDVAAIGLGLDLTRREAQAALKAKGLPWTKAKSFLGAAPVSPFIPTETFQNPDEIQFSLHVGGALRQKGNTRDMLNSATAIMNHLLEFTPLYPGDIIFTGTPPGVGPIRKGDTFTLAFTESGLAFSGTL